MSQTRLNIVQLRAQGAGDIIATDAEVSTAFFDHTNSLNPHPLAGDEKVVNKGIPGGYTPLDLNGYIPVAAIPVQTVVTIVQAMNMDGGTY